MDWGVSVVVYNDPMNILIRRYIYIPVHIVFFVLHHYVFHPVIFMKQYFTLGDYLGNSWRKYIIFILF
jgi:hypothetical protein